MAGIGVAAGLGKVLCDAKSCVGVHWRRADAGDDFDAAFELAAGDCACGLEPGRRWRGGEQRQELGLSVERRMRS